MTFSHKGLNLTAGAAFQSFDLNGTYQSPDPTFFKGKVDNKFNLWLPYAEFNGSITRNTWINADYGISATEPFIENLLPVIDYSNPLFITQGNPDLVPTLNHRVGVWFNHSWPADAIRINLSTNYTYFEIETCWLNALIMLIMINFPARLCRSRKLARFVMGIVWTFLK